MGSVLALVAFSASAMPAYASNHLIKIRQAYAGSVAHPDSDYVELQMYATGEHFVGALPIRIYDASGTLIHSYTFPGALGAAPPGLTGIDQRTILVAHSGADFAAEFPGVTPDFTATAGGDDLDLPAAGGAVCFISQTAGFTDCVSWGNFTGGASLPAPGVVSPAQLGGLPAGQALRRSIADNCSTLLEGDPGRDDDTNVSSSDFSAVSPVGDAAPRPNTVTPTETRCPPIKVREVYAGGGGFSDSNFIELQMLPPIPGQGGLNGRHVIVYNAAGSVAESYTFSGNAGTTATQRSVLIGDTGLASEFPGVTADFTDANLEVINAAGGAVCATDLNPSPSSARADCVSWGSFSGSLPTSAGTPIDSTGIPAAESLTRKISAGCPSLLEAADDTNVSNNDFANTSPTPRPNSVTPTEAACSGTPQVPQLKIREAYAGGGSGDDFIALQLPVALATGSTPDVVAGREVKVYRNAAGTLTHSFFFPTNPAQGATQRTILIGGVNTASSFGPTPDYVDSRLKLPDAAGAVCVTGSTPVDCVSWGNFTGTLPAPAAGTPADASGIPVGQSLRRRATANCPNFLEPADDTDSSESDFTNTNPSPRSNATAPTEVSCGSPPPDPKLKIREVYAGSAAHPEADFVELQMPVSSQNLVNGRELIIYQNPAGTATHSVFFTADPPQAGTQRTILVGDTDVSTEFGVNPDFTDYNLNLNAAGGAACLLATGPVDCVSWGSFSGTLPAPGAGVAAAALVPSQSLMRSIAPNCPTALDIADDSDDSDTDFSLGAPAPRSNAGSPAEITCAPEPDTTAPETAIASGPKARVKTRGKRYTAKFSFNGTDPSAPNGPSLPLHFACGLDGHALGACTSPLALRLKPGKHTFSVRACDAAGNFDPTPASRVFKITRIFTRNHRPKH